MSVPAWNAAGITGRSAWDILALGTWELPGIWRVSGKIGIKLDTKVVKGKKGATTTNEGVDPGSFTASGEMSLDELREFESGIDAIHPRNATDHSEPTDITYPSLAVLGVSQVRIGSISLPQLSDDLAVVTMELVEYFEAPKPTKARKPSSKPSQVYEQYAVVSNPWKPTGIDVLDSQWPANPANVQSVTPFGA